MRESWRNSILSNAEWKLTVPVPHYVKFILEKGALGEKREQMQSFTSKLILINKRVTLD